MALLLREAVCGYVGVCGCACVILPVSLVEELVRFPYPVVYRITNRCWIVQSGMTDNARGTLAYVCACFLPGNITYIVGYTMSR